MQATTTGTSVGPGRKLIGGAIALGGALLMLVGSFLTWLESSFDSFSGWDLYESQNDAGEFPFMIDEMFRSTFDPFFTGGATVALGGLLAVLALAVLLSPERPLPHRTRVHPLLYAVSVIAAVTAFIVMAVNLRTVFTRPDGVDLSIAIGFWVPVVGTLAAAVGLTSAAARTRRELAQPVAQTTIVAATPPSGGPAAPGWYADPAHRHQLRYWDGTAWSTHVADAGASSEDPVGADR